MALADAVARQLDGLCGLLREAGLRVGLQEELRLGIVLERLGGAEAGATAETAEALLADCLAAVLVKAPGERAVFQQVFAVWAAKVAAERAAPPPPGSPGLEAAAVEAQIVVEWSTAPERMSSGRRARLALPRWHAGILDIGRVRLALPRWRAGILGTGRARRLILLGALVLALAAFSLGLRRWLGLSDREPGIVTPPPPALMDEPAKAMKDVARVTELAKPGDRNVFPRLSVTNPGGPRWSRSAAGLAGLAALCGPALFLLLRRREYLPRVAPTPMDGAPARVLPRGAPGNGAALLDRRDVVALLSGVDRFVSEEPTWRLDASATARATAAANGRPELRFQRRRGQREVFLWIDRTAGALAPGQAALVEQLATELTQALGRAGLPVDRGEFFGVPGRLLTSRGALAPAELEAQREGARVLILTDGRLLSARLSDRRTARVTDALLRRLAAWPFLWFCDVSEGGHGLSGKLQRFGLSAVAPAAAASVLAGVAPRKTADGGAAAPGEPELLPWPVRALAAVLALPPFPVDEVLAQCARRALVPAAGPWDVAAVRALAGAAGDRLVFDGPRRAALLRWLAAAEPAMLAAAAHFFRLRLRDLPAAAGSFAALYRHLDMALLDLWARDPAVVTRAVERLYALHGGPGQEGALRGAVRAALAELAPAEAAPPPGVTPARVLLPFASAALPPRLDALLRHMGLAGAGQPAGPLQQPGRVLLGWGLCLGVFLGALGALRVVPQAPLWYAEAGARPEGAVVTTDPLPARPAGTGLLRSAVPFFRVMARTAGETANVELVNEVAAGGAVLIEWLRRADCPYAEQRDEKTGVLFVRVCGGTFEMGSKESDENGYPNERPAHPVLLSVYWIGQREVSNAEYRRLHPGHRPDEPAEWPATRLGWAEARAFCQAAGGDLPSEAQWEYAARGSDGRKYPWGDEPPDAERAVTNRKVDGGKEDHPNPVSSHSRGRGPFGTFDQAGNVWEWVLDCYQSYKLGQLVENPVVEKIYCSRVLRGGSAWNEPSYLRAAYRNQNPIENRNRNDGFRCARSSRR